MSRKIKQKRGLIVVAHPDDETIFFGGLILSRKYSWHVICVTDGNADGLGEMRRVQFEQACKLLGVKKAERWDFPDIFEKRLNVTALRNQLANLGDYDAVFTHGILGEYGHPHHQDVSMAVHEAFPPPTPVYSTAYNILPQLRIHIKEKDFALKTKVLWDIYSGEVRRFLNFLHATSSEGFTKVDRKEVRALYQVLTEGGEPDSSLVKSYRWLLPHIRSNGANLKVRPF